MLEYFNQVEACTKYPDTRLMALAGAQRSPISVPRWSTPPDERASRYEAWFTNWLPDYVDKYQKT